MATIVVVLMQEVTTMANSLVVNLLNFLLVSLSSLANPTLVKVSFPLHSLKSQSKSNFQQGQRPVCYIYGKNGHTALDCYHRMNFAYQGRHPSANLALMAASSMVANSGSHPNQNWLTDICAFDHITLDLSQLSLHQQPTTSETVTMGKNYLSLILVMVSFSLNFTISILITFLGYHIFLQNYFQCIKFVYKIIPFVILRPISSQFRIYLWEGPIQGVE